MPAEAATSEDAYEDWLSDIDDRGKVLDRQMFLACRWVTRVVVKTDCGEPPASLDR